MDVNSIQHLKPRVKFLWYFNRKEVIQYYTTLYDMYKEQLDDLFDNLEYERQRILLWKRREKRANDSPVIIDKILLNSYGYALTTSRRNYYNELEDKSDSLSFLLGEMSLIHIILDISAKSDTTYVARSEYSGLLREPSEKNRARNIRRLHKKYGYFQ